MITNTITVETLIEAISVAQKLQHLLEKELGYSWPVTDEIRNIIDALEYDLELEQEGLGDA